MSLQLFLRMKEAKKCSEPLISLQKKESRIQEATKKMNTQKLSTPIYRYVMGIYKGSGETLGNIAAHARIFESDMNAWIDGLEAREGLIR